MEPTAQQRSQESLRLGDRRQVRMTLDELAHRRQIERRKVERRVAVRRRPE